MKKYQKPRIRQIVTGAVTLLQASVSSPSLGSGNLPLGGNLGDANTGSGIHID